MNDFVKYCNDHGIDRKKMTPIARDRLLYEISPEMRESCKKMIGMWLESYDQHNEELKEIRKKLKRPFHKKDLEKRYAFAEIEAKEALANAIEWAMKTGWKADNADREKEIILAHKSEYIEHYRRATNPEYYEWEKLNAPYRGNVFG